MLLTSSQISMGISSAIVFTFSTLLFLSGYILQQQTVRDIQGIIRPIPAPSPPSEADLAITLPTPSEAMASVNWDKVAYISLLAEPSKACSAAILFAELARQNSRAKRILLYPQRWLADSLTSEIRAGPDAKARQREREYTMRFLRKIAARYDVLLRPVEVDVPTVNTADGAAHGQERGLSLHSMYTLTEFQMLMYLNPSGVVYDVMALDELFALDPAAAGIHFISTLPGTDGQEDQDQEQEPLASLFKPSMSTHAQILLANANTNTNPNAQLSSILAATSSTPKHASRLFTSTRNLSPTHNDNNDDSDTDTETDTDSGTNLPAYLHFDETSIPGPDYDIPRDMWRAARPEREPERTIWESVYADYRAQRMGVCGLDVQVLPRNWREGKGKALKLDEAKLAL